jgi:CDP-glucose 4,6-dehydratase
VEYRAGRATAEPSALNFGPVSDEPMTVAQLSEAIGEKLGNTHRWRQAAGTFPPEGGEQRLDSTLATKTLKWRPRLDLAETIAWTAQWYADFAAGKDALELMRSQIARYNT